MMDQRNQWEPYNPQWLVELAVEQRPDYPWLPEALAKCTQKLQKSHAYIYFVDSSNANTPGASWQFETNISLESPTEGWLILDILQGQRVGGIEFYNRLFKRPS